MWFLWHNCYHHYYHYYYHYHYYYYYYYYHYYYYYYYYHYYYYQLYLKILKIKISVIILSRHCSERFKMLTYCDVIDTGADRQQLWRHNDRLFPCGCYGQWFKEFVKDTSVPSFSTFWKKSMKPWNVWQVTSWLTGKGHGARYEIMVCSGGVPWKI